MFNYNPFRNFIGLDISDFKIRFFQLSKNLKNQKIKSYGEVRNQLGYVTNGEITNAQGVSGLIKELLSKPQYGKVDTKYVVASLPDKKTYIKTFEIPEVPENEMAGAVQWGIEQNFPVEIDEVYYDWIRVPTVASTGNEKKATVLACVTPNSLVDSYTSLLKSSGLVPICLENESFAIARSLVKIEDSEQIRCIIDLGRSRTNFIVAYSGLVIYTSTIEVSGNQMTLKISESMKLSFDESEKAKIIYGLNQNKARGQIFKIIEPLLNLLVVKIHENIDFFNSNFGNKKIAQILLTGSVSHMVGLGEYLRLQLNKKIIPGDPLVNLKKFEVDKSVDTGKFNSYSTAIGLAMKKVQI